MLKKLLCSERVSQDRINICNTCEYKTKINTCSVCKCILPLKVKFMFSDCPKGKWKKNYVTTDEW